MYRVSDHTHWTVLWNWTRDVYTHTPLRSENKEVKGGQRDSEPWLLQRHLLPTQILQKLLKQTFQPRQLTDRRTKMQGHMLGTGASVPSPLQAKCFGKAGTWRLIGGQCWKDRESFLSPWLQQSISLRALRRVSVHSCWTGTRRQFNEIIIISE